MQPKEAKAIKHLIGSGSTNERLVMTVDDLVKLGFGSRNTLYRLARLDQLPVPTITVGRKLYFSRFAIQKLLENDWVQEGLNNAHESD